MTQTSPGSSSFTLPALPPLSSFGWGPSSASLPSQLLGLPFLPFSKGERLSRISDWTQTRPDGRGGIARAAVQEEDDGNLEIDENQQTGQFSVVDSKIRPRQRVGFKPFKKFSTSQNNNQKTQQNQSNQNNRRWGQPTRVQQNKNAGPQGTNFTKSKQSQNQNWSSFAEKEIKSHSVQIQEEWGKPVAEIELSALNGMTFDPAALGEPLEMSICGELYTYNTAFNRITPKNPVLLQRFENRQNFTGTTSADPVLAKFAMEKLSGVTVVGTDTIIGLLMSAHKSVAVWDVIITVRQDGVVLLDKRPLSRIDYLSVNENATSNNIQVDMDPKSINHSDQLAAEATFINHNFMEQCVKRDNPMQLSEPNPFASSLPEGSESASVAFRYRKFNMGDDLTLITRTTVNAYTSRGEENLYVTARALNEYDSRASGTVDYRQKLEQQTGAVLASEMKNNQFKLCRWSAEAVLSGSHQFTLGFVSRVNTKYNNKHVILMCKQYSVQTFLDSVNIRIKTLWGALKVLLERIKQLEKGKTYILCRDPNLPKLSIYEIPKDAFAAEQQNEETQQ